MSSRTLPITLTLAALAVALGGCATQSQPAPPSEQSQSKGSSGASMPARPGSPAPSAPASSGAAATTPPSGPGSVPEATRSTSTSGNAGSAQTGPAQTPDERRAAIDRRLEGSLGTFDETLRKEQKAVAEEKDARDAEAATSGSADADGIESAQDPAGEADAGSAKTENPTVEGDGSTRPDTPSRPGDLRSDKDRAAGNKAASGSGASVGNIPDGSDDDIVARRLRKAAEQETDPELKEKLWKEYIEYKKNAGK